MQEYKVKLEVFEGPLDLLLYLIKRDEVDIHDIPIGHITKQYLDFMELFKMLDLDVATEFLLIASTLVELKTRRLLPGREDMDLDEELAMWSERDLLLARLLDCKTFKDVASVFSQLTERASLSFPRRSGPDERFADLLPDMLDGVTPLRLQRAYLRVTQPKPPTSIDLFHVAPIRASVAEALMEMLETLPKLGKVTFRQITEAIYDRIEVVVRFLAILELYKQGRVSLEQSDRFGEIEVQWTAGDDTGFEAVLQIDDYEG